MWGSCFWFCIPSASSSSRSRRAQLAHTHTCTHNLLTHNLLTHNLLTHTQLAHTQLTHTHTQLAHTQLAHTQLAHTHTTYSHTTCSHTQMLPLLYCKNFFQHANINFGCHYCTAKHLEVSHSHTTYSHTTCSHTTCTHTQLTHTQLAHTQLTHTHAQLAHTQLAHAQLAHTQLTHTQLAHTHKCCHYCTAKTSSNMQISTSVATIVLQNIWKFLTHTQLTHTQLAHTQLTHTQLPHTTSIVTLRGRCGTYGTGLALAARLVSHGAVTPRRFAWQAWHFVTSAFTLYGRRGTLWHLRSIHRHFVWQAWHLMIWIVTLRGRRGTYGTGLALAGTLGQPWRRDAAAFCVAGVALRDICLHFVWQAWHFVTSAFTLCGRRDTSWHLPSLCVVGVALMALGWLWRRAWSAMAPWRRGVLRGRRGTSRHLPSLCVAGVALRDICLHFVWQAWQPWHLETSTFVSRGRRGTSWHLPCHHTTCLHTTCPHTTCLHTTCPHTTCPLVITPLVSSHYLYTHNLLTRNLSSDHISSHHLSSHHLSSHYLSSHYLSTGRQKKRSRSWQIRTVSAQSVATILVLLAFSGSYITALAAVAWQVHHAAMSWSLLVLLQLTVLICLLSICASETNSFGDSRCFLLFCEAPTSSRRCCCSIHAYIHTYIQTYIQTYIHTFIHTYIHSCMHACIHAYTTYSYRSIRACYCERAGAVWGDLMLLD